MREVDKNSWPCSYHVHVFASAWLWLSPTACCRVMLNSPSSRSTPEPPVGACAGFPGPYHQGHPCSWPGGEHQVWRSASSGHASGRTRAGPGQDPSGTCARARSRTRYVPRTKQSGPVPGPETVCWSRGGPRSYPTRCLFQKCWSRVLPENRVKKDKHGHGRDPGRDPIGSYTTPVQTPASH